MGAIAKLIGPLMVTQGRRAIIENIYMNNMARSHVAGVASDILCMPNNFSFYIHFQVNH